MRTGTFFPSSIAAMFFLSPTCSPFLPGLPALSKSDLGDLPYWKAPGIRKNNLIFPATKHQENREELAIFLLFSHKIAVWG